MNTEQIEQIARVVHETNRAYCDSIGDSSQNSWNDCEEWQRESARAGVVKVLENPEITPEQLHQAWCDFKVADGWQYGPVKDAANKLHPCLVPYDGLPVEQRKKDGLFRAIVNVLTTE